ncbi:MAG: hypothetical protein A3H96_12135 [Acidobacteria bacterium RIFCSPLOWO2_02_FULL_67_36]|nr:MAG: hypothetical protein A3H96_12135 [Acidobacteria bacterium RIFCSPLOWO2_02_FULL_67_36]
MGFPQRSTLAGLVLLALLTPASSPAQEAVTMVFRSGESAGVELVDLGGVGFTIRQGGVDSARPDGQRGRG